MCFSSMPWDRDTAAKSGGQADQGLHGRHSRPVHEVSVTGALTGAKQKAHKEEWGKDRSH